MTYPLVTHALSNETNQGNSSFCQSSVSPKEVEGMLLTGLLLHDVQQKHSRGSEISEKKKKERKKTEKENATIPQLFLSSFTVI